MKKVKVENEEKPETDNNDYSQYEEYEMISTEFKYDELKESLNFRIKKYHDAIYRGELVLGKR
jgi:hypothetical protein